MGELFATILMWGLLGLFYLVVSAISGNNKKSIGSSKHINDIKNEQKSQIESSIGSSSINSCDRIVSPTIDSSYTIKSIPFNIENGTTYYYWITRNITLKRFSTIREYAADKINGCSVPLPDRGVSPLHSERELNQYIFSYGNMHYAKLKSALSYLPANLFQESLEIIDWGCGQGIATITLLELKRPRNVKFTLIEPGLLALKRAALNTKCFFEVYTSGTFNCKTINKSFDDLIRSDVSTSPNRTKIHLFSNTLDIEGRYSQLDLVNLIKRTQSGKNYFVCCSPYIDFGKRQKIDTFVNSFKRMKGFHLYCSVNNSKENDWWECNRHFKGYSLCRNKDCEDCNEKWTRIIRVFSVEL